MISKNNPLRVLYLSFLVLCAPPLAAQEPGGAAGDAGEFGVLVMAHGGGPQWNAGVLETLETLEGRWPLEVAFGMADAVSLQDAVDRLEARGVDDIAVVRLFISGESWHERTRQILGLQEGAPARSAAAAQAHAPGQEHGEEHAHGQGHGEEHGALAHAGTGGRPQGQEHGANHGEELGALAQAGSDGRPQGQEHEANHGAEHGQAHAGQRHGGAAAGQTGQDGAGQAGGHSMEFWRVDSGARFAVSADGRADAGEISEVLLDRALALSRDPAAEDVLILAHGPETEEENARWLAAMDELAAPLKEHGFRNVRSATLREDWPEARESSEQEIRDFVQTSSEAGRQPLVIPFRVHGFGPYAEVLEGLDYVADETGLIPHPAVGRWIARQAEALRDGLMD